MKTLVTGGTGLLGNNVVRTLLKEGHSVRALVRESSNESPLAGLDVERFMGDIRDRDAVHAAVDGVDAVVHAAGYVQLGWRHGKIHQQINVEGTQNVAQAALDNQAHLVHVSTISTLGVGWHDRAADEEHVNANVYRCPYVESKRAGEQCVEALTKQALRATVVHPGYLLGPWDWKPSSGKMLVDVVRRWTPLAPGGSFSLTDARDVAAGIHRVIEREPIGRHFILAGHNMSYAEGWHLFARTCGGKGPVWRMRAFAHFLAGHGGDVWGRLTKREPLINSASMGLGRQCHTFSSRRAETELGYNIRPAEETINDTWQWFQQHGYA